MLVSMYCCSISCSILRYCQKSTVLNGVTVPKGVIVDVPVYTIHKDPRYWPNPEVFDPERWMDICIVTVQTFHI